MRRFAYCGMAVALAALAGWQLTACPDGLGGTCAEVVHTRFASVRFAAGSEGVLVGLSRSELIAADETEFAACDDRYECAAEVRVFWVETGGPAPEMPAPFDAEGCTDQATAVAVAGDHSWHAWVPRGGGAEVVRDWPEGTVRAQLEGDFWGEVELLPWSDGGVVVVEADVANAEVYWLDSEATLRGQTDLAMEGVYVAATDGTQLALARLQACQYDEGPLGCQAVAVLRGAPDNPRAWDTVTTSSWLHNNWYGLALWYSAEAFRVAAIEMLDIDASGLPTDHRIWVADSTNEWYGPSFQFEGGCEQIEFDSDGRVVAAVQREEGLTLLWEQDGSWAEVSLAEQAGSACAEALVHDGERVHVAWIETDARQQASAVRHIAVGEDGSVEEVGRYVVDQPPLLSL